MLNEFVALFENQDIKAANQSYKCLKKKLKKKKSYFHLVFK